MRKFVRTLFSWAINTVFKPGEKEIRILSLLHSAPEGSLEEEDLWDTAHDIWSLIMLDDMLEEFHQKGWVEKTVSSVGHNVSYSISEAGIVELHRRLTA